MVSYNKKLELTQNLGTLLDYFSHLERRDLFTYMFVSVL